MNYHVLILYLLLPLYGLAQSSADEKRQERSQQEYRESNYADYHRAISEAEKLIGDQEYEKALSIYRQVTDSYDFVFLKEYRIATQLALYVGRPDEAFTYLKKGIASGWDWKSVRKNRFLKKLQSYPEWRDVKRQHVSLRKVQQEKINTEVRAVVKGMFGNDQRKAFRALLTFGSKGQDRYAEKTFAPHSEKQLAKLDEIIKKYGYPGEKLIGNSFWTMVILTHHNSITERYAQKDTLYPHIRPQLLKAVEYGQMSPYEFARVDDWYIVVKSGRRDKAYGYLNSVQTETERTEANQRREQAGLSSIEVIKGLADAQRRTGMNFYLPRAY